ncbi:MAG TPA: hypothetical protein DCL68_06115, partial [Gammaproteobacteria bacterium]|nr:hypothetical protein [Gammaproteobacteria bacterium]
MFQSPKINLSFTLVFMVLLLAACGSPKEENELYMTVGGTGIPNTVGVKHFYDFEQAVKEKLPTIETKML